MTTIKQITQLIEASSLGTRPARTARRAITAAQGDALVRAADATDERSADSTTNSGIHTMTGLIDQYPAQHRDGQKRKAKKWPKAITAAP